MLQKNRLRAFRKAKKLSLEALSDQTGKAFQTISEYERGLQTMPAEFLMKAAEALGCSPEEITEPEAAPVTSGCVEFLNEKEPQWSKGFEPTHPLELQQHITALEFVLGKLTKEQAQALYDELSPISQHHHGLTLAVQILITSALQRAAHKQKNAATPHN